MAKAFQFRARLHESVRSRRLFAPEGLLRVAQRFNAGNDGHNKPAQAPPGATETLPNRSFVSGTSRRLRADSPSDESLGYCRVSLRDKTPAAHARH